VDIRVDVNLPCSAKELLPFIDDLAQYPSWMCLVHAVVPEADNQAWQVELRGKIGPFARSKRLRMVQSTCESPNIVVFERRETDGRKHSSWVLTAQVGATSVGSNLIVNLHYGGTLFTGGVLEGVLADQITQGRERLLAVLQA